MTRNMPTPAAHAGAAAGLAFQLASASTMPIGGSASAATETIRLRAMSGFSFDGAFGRSTPGHTSCPARFQGPSERLSEVEQRLFQHGHDQPVDDHPP